MTTLNAQQIIFTRLIADHAEKLVRDAVLCGEPDWQAMARGLVFLSRQYGGQLPVEHVELATEVYLDVAARAREEIGERTTAAILEMQQRERRGKGQVPS